MRVQIIYWWIRLTEWLERKALERILRNDTRPRFTSDYWKEASKSVAALHKPALAAFYLRNAETLELFERLDMLNFIRDARRLARQAGGTMIVSDERPINKGDKRC